jgi:hypothetical protein
MYFATESSQKDNVVLSINAPSRFDGPLCFDLADSTCRILKRMDLEIEEPETIHRAAEPRNVTHNLHSPG